MATLNAAHIGSDGFTVFIDGKPYILKKDHANYERALEELKSIQHNVEGAADVLMTLVDIPHSIRTFSNGTVEVTSSEVLYKGKPLHNGLTRRILQMMKEGFNIKPMAAFLENLMANPSYRAVQELYDFLDACQLPITEDGHFLAYKKVKNDYTDIYSGQFDNSPGAVCEMPRNEVDEDKNQTCSNGLHFCSISYLPHFGTSYYNDNDRVMIVKINPADVVAIPRDYDNAKGRTARYEVVDEWMGWDEFVANNEDLFKTSVVTNYTPPAPKEPKKSRDEMTQEEIESTRAWQNGRDDGLKVGEQDAADGYEFRPETHLYRGQVNNPGFYTQAFLDAYDEAYTATSKLMDEAKNNNVAEYNKDQEETESSRAWKIGKEDGEMVGEDDSSNGKWNLESRLTTDQLQNPGPYSQGFMEGYKDAWNRVAASKNSDVDNAVDVPTKQQDVSVVYNRNGGRLVPRYNHPPRDEES